MQNLKLQFKQSMSQLFEPSSNIIISELYYMGNIQKMKNILEIGPGSGSIYPILINQKQKSAKYTAIDLESDLLEIGKNRIENLLNKENKDIYKVSQEQNDNFSYYNTEHNIELKVMNANKLDFQDNSIDGVFTSFCLHHTDWDQPLSEIYRVLQKDGKLVFAEMEPNPQVFIKQISTVEQILSEVLAEKYTDFQKERDNQQKNIHQHHHQHQFLTKEQIKEKLTKFGFKIQLQYEKLVTISLQPENCLEYYKLGLQNHLKSLLDEQKLQEVQKRVFEAILEFNNYKPHGYQAQVFIAIK